MRKLKKYPIGPLYTSVLFLMCKFHWSRIHLRLVTRGERGRGRAGPRGGKNFRRPYLVCKFFPRVETLSIVFPMVELPYDHIFIVIREKNYTSPYRASILSRNVSYTCSVWARRDWSHCLALGEGRRNDRNDLHAIQTQFCSRKKHKTHTLVVFK